MKLEIEGLESPDVDTPPTLCLNMIVKNESKVITRMFDSVIPIIDCYCICDTGSTDNTKEIITSYFAEKGIPGLIVEKPFVDFAFNRNFALQSCYGMSDYVLLMDADMMLDIKPSFDKNILRSHDSFMILQGNDEFYYNNMRIVANNMNYLYYGVTHEYISCAVPSRLHNFEKNTLFICDIGDGGAKSDKFERDVRLLEKGIEDHPTSDRYHFYLANTYFDSGFFEKAIPLYKKRVAMGGWEQEIWNSHYKIGHAYQNLGRIEEAISAWLDAYEAFPRRVENLYEIIKHYREVGKCKLAEAFYKLAKEAASTASDKDTYLFLHNDVYTYKLEYESSIISCYVGKTNVNDQVVTVFNHCKEEGIIQNTLSNMKYYKDILSPVMVLDLSSKIDVLIGGKNRPFTSSSTCLIPDVDAASGGYTLNIRFVNYTIDDGGYYHGCEDHIITMNKMVHLSKEFQLREERLLDTPFDGRRYIGIEDVRIFHHNGRLHFIGTGLHDDGRIGISAGYYDSPLCSKNIKPDFNDAECEKNWVFVPVQEELMIVYGWSPLHVCKMDIDQGVLQSVQKETNVPAIFKLFRGSTSAAQFEQELWFITHIVSYEAPRHYYHVFVVFDRHMKLLRYSAPFKFEGECIEYCLSLVVEKNRVIVPYSTWDRTTKIAIYEKSYVESLCKYK